ncbi:MAG: S8 family serine peptidase [Actinomycetota bacterium]|nr:S8 family serine peptidase [Actinomycetota bacterium]
MPAAAAAAPAPSTGNLLVLVDRGSRARAAGSAAWALIGAGGRLVRSVPQIGLLTVRPAPGVAPTALAATLRGLAGVQSVQPERRYVPRTVPNDPALSTPDSASGVVQWAPARENFPAAWSLSHGDGALVGVVDSGVDASQPDLAGKIAAAVDQEQPAGSATSDQVGHGTHVSSLACAGTNNGVGMAGAGYDCKLVVEKSDFSDSSIDAAIVDAADHHVQAINMSFGPAQPTGAPAPEAEVRALQYAAAHGVVLVAAASDSPGTEQGDPANVLQPAATAADLTKGIGLDVTAAQYNGQRASFAGYGREISLAAYGAFQPDAGGLLGLGGSQPGIFGAFPGNSTQLESSLLAPCHCRTTFGGDNRWAYLAGTSMAAPQVAATAAMMRVLNPFATVAEVIRTLKLTASRAAGTGFSEQLGWGVLNAGAALDAVRRIDHLSPIAEIRAPHVSRGLTFLVRWSGRDQQRPALIASGIARYEVYVKEAGRRLLQIASTARQALRFRARPGRRYTFLVYAVDRAGNRQVKPARALTRVLAPRSSRPRR